MYLKKHNDVTEGEIDANFVEEDNDDLISKGIGNCEDERDNDTHSKFIVEEQLIREQDTQLIKEKSLKLVNYKMNLE